MRGTVCSKRVACSSCVLPVQRDHLWLTGGEQLRLQSKLLLSVSFEKLYGEKKSESLKAWCELV